MSLIDYQKYLDGDEWPSESKKAVVDERGYIDPTLVPVIDMPPQYAAAALHKLLRWARSMAMNAKEEADWVHEVRSSMLGRLLTRQTLGIEDFELTGEHGILRAPLSNRFVARELCRLIMDIEEDLDPVEAARLSTELALRLSDDGLTVYKETA